MVLLSSWSNASDHIANDVSTSWASRLFAPNSDTQNITAQCRDDWPSAESYRSNGVSDGLPVGFG